MDSLLGVLLLSVGVVVGQFHLLDDGSEPPSDCSEELWNNHPNGWLWYRPHQTNCSRYWTCEIPVWGKERWSIHECDPCGPEVHEKCQGREALTFDIDFGMICVWPDEAHAQCGATTTTAEGGEITSPGISTTEEQTTTTESETTTDLETEDPTTDITTTDYPVDSTTDSAVDSTSLQTTDYPVDSTTMQTTDSPADSTTDSDGDSTTIWTTDSSLDSTTLQTTDSLDDSTTILTTDSPVDSTTMQTTDPPVDSTTMQTTGFPIDTTTMQTDDSSVESTTMQTTHSPVDSTTMQNTDYPVDSTTFQTTIPSTEAPECRFSEHICMWGVSNGELSSFTLPQDLDTLEEQAESCQASCADDMECRFFTTLVFRGRANCYHLNHCQQGKDISCMTQGDCISGPNVC